MLPILLLTTTLLAAPPRAAAFPQANGRAVRNAMLVQDGVIYLGGDFTEIGGQSRAGLAAIDLESGKLLPWAPKLEGGGVSALAWKDGLIYAGGDFEAVEGEDQASLAAFSDARSGPAAWVRGWRPEVEGHVADLLAGATILVAGGFDEVNGEERLHLAELRDASGPATLTRFKPAFDARVCSLARDPEGNLIVGGFFRSAAGEPRDLLAKFSPEGRLLPQRIQIEGGRSKEILRLVVDQGRLYVAGVEIAAVGGQPRLNAFCLDARDFGLAPWRCDLDAGAGALSAQGGRVLIGGDFFHINGEARRLALVDGQSGAVDPWDPHPNHNSYAACLWENGFVVSGYWTRLDGAPVAQLARFGGAPRRSPARPAPLLSYLGSR
jgi:hypothetical protein